MTKPPMTTPKPPHGGVRRDAAETPDAGESKDRDEPGPADGEQLAPEERQSFEEGAMRERDA
jgi:hypothetical protein